MNMNEYILEEIKPLCITDAVKSAQKKFENYPITHFPVIENNKLLGSFGENDIQTIENKEDRLSTYAHLLHSFYADEKATVLELLKKFADNDANIIPVLNEFKDYLGYFDLRDVLDVFSTSPFMFEQSETLIIAKQKNDYSMSQIVQIIESNGGKLLGVYISETKLDMIQITVKFISKEINEIMQSLRRYDYKIISIHENDLYLEDLKNRSEYLQKYLEI